MADPATGATVRQVFLDKHPQPAVPHDDVLLPGEAEPANPVIFKRLTLELIKKLSAQMKGSCGPLGLDSDAWCRMTTCFMEASDRLCCALAAAVRCLCSETLEADAMIGFALAHLIPLDKKPGVRPIAVGEVSRRLISRAIMTVVRSDVRRVTTPLQTCVGVPSACEAAVHTISGLFARPMVEGVLMVDASNAFNSLNRQVALHNLPRLCPALARVFVNTYSSPIRLFVSGGGEVLSAEGTCQGDPLAMAIYAVDISPLVKHLAQVCPTVTQSWYDDDSAADCLQPLRTYWDELKAVGPGYGYHPNPSKTMLVVKADVLDRARDIFGGTGIKVTWR